MNNIKLDNKNSILQYQPTGNMYYDIEGQVRENNGKDIKIEKKMNDEVIQYTIRLKEEIEAKAGEKTKIKKENIQSIKMEKKEEENYTDDEIRDIGKILKDLGLEYTEENIKMIQSLTEQGIKPTKGNIESYKKSKEILGEIIQEIDTVSIIRMLDTGIDPEEASLEQVLDTLKEVKNIEEKFSIKEFLNLEKQLDYGDAEKISEEIYGQKMGKDVYDIIIALDKEGLSIDRINIENGVEVLSKINNLKNIEDGSFIQVLDYNMEFSINNLFKLKNDYNLNSIDSNSLSGKFEEFNLIEDVSLDSIRQVLTEQGIEDTERNLQIGREFILLNMNIDSENHERVIHMSEKLIELRNTLTDENIVSLLDRNIDVLEEDIDELMGLLQNMEILEQTDDIDIGQYEDMEILESIQDRDLLKLIQSGKDFNLENIKEIQNTDIRNDLSFDFKVLDRTLRVKDMFQIIGENPKIETIQFSANTSEEVSLERLYESQLELNKSNIQVDNISEEREKLILNEYLKSRNDMTINIIRESIKDGSQIESMPLGQLNSYMEKKINRYKEIDDLASQIKGIKDNSERIIPLIMKNDLNMTLKEIGDINAYLKGEEGVSKTISEILRNTEKYTENYRESIITLQREISKSIKIGDMGVKENYKDLHNLFLQGDSEFDKRENPDRENKFFQIQKKLSKNDMLFQLPVEIDGNFKDLNIIIPDRERDMDGNNMNFSVIIQTDNLGSVNMDLKIVGRDITIQIQEEENILSREISYLKDSLREMGYNLQFMEDERNG